MHLNFNIKHFYSVSAFPFPSSQKLKTESSTFRHLKEMRNSHQLRLHPDCRQHPLLGQGAAAICRLFAYSSLSLSLSLWSHLTSNPLGGKGNVNLRRSTLDRAKSPSICPTQGPPGDAIVLQMMMIMAGVRFFWSCPGSICCNWGRGDTFYREFASFLEFWIASFLRRFKRSTGSFFDFPDHLSFRIVTRFKVGHLLCFISIAGKVSCDEILLVGLLHVQFKKFSFKL